MKLTRRKILASIGIAGVSAASAGIGTAAYLSDDSLSNISINVGSLSLSDPATITWSENPDTQGEDVLSERITVENTGNLPARQVVLTEIDWNDKTLAKALEITAIRYGQDELDTIKIDEWLGGDQNGNGVFDLHDLKMRLPVHLDAMTSTSTVYAGEKAHLEIDAKLDYSQIPDDKEGAEFETDLTVRGQQNEPAENSTESFGNSNS